MGNYDRASRLTRPRHTAARRAREPLRAANFVRALEASYERNVARARRRRREERRRARGRDARLYPETYLGLLVVFEDN